jgi:hypothetical protein
VDPFQLPKKHYCTPADWNMPPADPEDPYKLTDETRTLGLIVCRGTAVTLVCPCEGMAEIANPFAQAEAS